MLAVSFFSMQEKMIPIKNPNLASLLCVVIIFAAIGLALPYAGSYSIGALQSLWVRVIGALWTAEVLASVAVEQPPLGHSEAAQPQVEGLEESERANATAIGGRWRRLIMLRSLFAFKRPPASPSSMV